jgi:putative transposase
MRLTADAAGHWYVTLACIDVPVKPLPVTGCDVGVDLGLVHFAATSDGTIFPNPRPLAAARITLERAHRRVSRRVRGSHRRRIAVHLLARHHQRVRNIRRENHISVAKALVERNDTIFVEALNIKGLAGGMLSKSVSDAGWGDFLRWLHVKAEEAGRTVVEVNPRGTSQTCPACGLVAPKLLSQRVHRCVCGLVCDRDVVAARVILGLGTSLRGAAPLSEGRQRSAKSKSACVDRTTP